MAAVLVEFREENLARLPSAVIVVVDDLPTDDLDRLEPLMDPLKKSILEPGRPLKRLREIASNPNICARERMFAVGVEGAELFPVRNLNNPN